MAYVTQRGRGDGWEVRESVATPKGPRSRTLATFRTLSAEAVERARARASTPLDADKLHEAARRAGAPIELPAADRAAAELIHELVAGRHPRPALERVLLDALSHGAGDPRLADAIARPPRKRAGRPPETEPNDDATSLDNARAAAAWLTATPQRRGDALWDLLELADALPHDRAGEKGRFPRLEPRTA